MFPVLCYLHLLRELLCRYADRGLNTEDRVHGIDALLPLKAEHAGVLGRVDLSLSVAQCISRVRDPMETKASAPPNTKPTSAFVGRALA